MTAADKLRELLATRPAMPNTEQLVRWWRTSGDLVPEVLAELDTLNQRDTLNEQELWLAGEPLRQTVNALDKTISDCVRRLDDALRNALRTGSPQVLAVEMVARALAFAVGLKREPSPWLRRGA